MKLIADSGSTKTEWILLKEETKFITTIGLNPVFVDDTIIAETILNSELNNFKTKIKEIHFFGAGCSSETRKQIIKAGLSKIFNNAKIEVESDLLGAGISMFGKGKGIIGILGTGSNTGFYEEGEITQNISSLGYILGDEGSGAFIGKAFLKAYLENELSENINKEFRKEFNINLDEIIKRIYKDKFPNRFLASFLPFIYNHKNDEFIQNILNKSFNSFFEKTICKYDNYKNLEIKLIGSVAHYFSEEINSSAKKIGINIIDISQSPSKGLIDFYK
jgi:N-acetylglucosamine kinase-like BadF-type ATPase